MADIKLSATQENVDPVAGFIEKSQSFIIENKNTLILGAIAILVAVGGLIGFNFYSESQEQKAQVLLSQAQAYFTANEFELALKGDDTSFTPGFETIISNYSGTRAANLARFYAAVSEYNMGNFESALSYMNSFSVPEGILGVSPIAFKASLHNQLGSYEEAAKNYELAANWHETTTTTPLYLIEAAKAYKAAGNNAKALSIINRVLEKYPTGSHSAEAKRVKGQVS